MAPSTELTPSLARAGNPLRPRNVLVRRYSIYFALLCVTLLAGYHVLVQGTDWARMGTASQMLKAIGKFVPDLAFLAKLPKPLLETVLMGFWGTVLAVVLSLPVAWLAARNITPLFPVGFAFGRGIIVLARSVHELIFALLFVSALGLGPLAGILALACRAVGFLAKTTAEAIENVDRGPIEAIEATGGGRLQVLCFAIVPQVLPIFLGNVIFQFDMNVRRAAILGMVGAGGIGLVFAEQMMELNYARAGSVVLAIVAIVILGEILSNRLRTRLISGS